MAKLQIRSCRKILVPANNIESNNPSPTSVITKALQ